MDCSSFEELMFAALDGPLAGPDEEARRMHAAGCTRCGALERLMSTEHPVPAAAAPEDLLESILIATSPAWARTFARLNRELPGLADVQPDAAFVTDVLAATTGAAAREAAAAAGEAAAAPRATTVPSTSEEAASFRAPRRVRGTDRLAAAWEALLQRPRLAFEGAYIGALALILLVGTPAWSLSISPAALITEFREERIEPALQSVNRRVEPIVAAAGENVSSFLTGVWSTARGRGSELWSTSVKTTVDRGRALWCAGFDCEIDPSNEPESDPSRRTHE